jgi:hypothetical protein
MTLGNSTYTWQDTIKTNLKDIRSDDVNRIQVAQNICQWNATMNTTRNFRYI